MLELVAIVIVAVFFVGGGLNAMWKGRIPATKTSTIEGLPARIVGLLLFLAVPLAFLAGLFNGPILGIFDIEPDPQSALPMLVFCAPLLACPLLAVAIGLGTAKPRQPGPKPAPATQPQKEQRRESNR